MSHHASRLLLGIADRRGRRSVESQCDLSHRQQQNGVGSDQFWQYRKSAPITLAASSETDEGQDWVVVPTPDGDGNSFAIVNPHSGLSMDMGLTGSKKLIQWMYEAANEIRNSMRRN